MPGPPTGPCETSQQHPKYTGSQAYCAVLYKPKGA